MHFPIGLAVRLWLLRMSSDFSDTGVSSLMPSCRQCIEKTEQSGQASPRVWSWDSQTSVRQCQSRQVSALSPGQQFACCLIQTELGLLLWSAVWFSNISTAFLFKTVFDEPKKALLFVVDVLDVQDISSNVKTVLSVRSKTTCQACEKIAYDIFSFRKYIFFLLLL